MISLYIKKDLLKLWRYSAKNINAQYQNKHLDI